MKIHATTAVAKFECLKSDCPDTCCKGWSMQVDDATFAKYQGTELEAATAHDSDYSGKTAEIRVMKRDPQTDNCVKLTDGICAIHKDYGAPMLGDACNFYPRVARKLGDETIMAASLSCPEIARLALFTEAPQAPAEIETERLPHYMPTCQTDGLSAVESLKIHTAFLAACASPDAPEKIMARIYSTAASLARIDKKDWPDAAPFMLKTADTRLPQAVGAADDKSKILQIFAAVIHATHKKLSPRLAEVIAHAENLLGVKINWETLELSLLENTPPSGRENINFTPSSGRGWGRVAESQPASPNPPPNLLPKGGGATLRNYIAAQLSFTAFPFAGLGATLPEKAKLLCYKFALAKVLINGLTTEAEIIQAIQSSARIIDHLASPELIFKLMDGFGWNTEARILGIFLSL